MAQQEPTDAHIQPVHGCWAPRPGAHSVLRRQHSQSWLQWYPAVQAQRRGAVLLPASTATRALPVGDKRQVIRQGGAASPDTAHDCTIQHPAQSSPDQQPAWRACGVNHQGTAREVPSSSLHFLHWHENVTGGFFSLIIKSFVGFF